MAMKKRFLPALMAGMVVVGSTGLVNADTLTNADTVTQKISGNDTQTLKADIDVFGTVTNNNGEGPEGKLTVELPTKMAFAVDQKSNVIGGNYTIKNSSKSAIDVYVSEFRTIKDGIQVVNAIDQNSTRANVKLELQGNQSQKVNLANPALNGSGDGIKVANVKGSNTGNITLSGEAGKKADPKVDANGASGEFNMVFKIKKANA